MRIMILRMLTTMPTCPRQIINLLAPCVDHQHRVLRILLVLLVRRAVAVVEQMEPGHNNIKSREKNVSEEQQQKQDHDQLLPVFCGIGLHEIPIGIEENSPLIVDTRHPDWQHWSLQARSLSSSFFLKSQDHFSFLPGCSSWSSPRCFSTR